MSGTSSDAASALRAAALSTLKSKRRHPKLAAPLRPVHQDTSVQLDYGQAAESTSPVDKLVTVASTSAPSVSEQDHSDGQAREEGEISDSEAAPDASTTHRQSFLDVKSTLPDAEVAGQARPPLVQTESPARVTQNEDHDRHPQVISPQIPCRPDHSATEAIRIIVDADHVRPGLSMTQGQYNQAKDIILDLLGWGVDPEYLVQCNLSREIIFYVFNELNLKIPSNLDITGVIPYPPSPDYLDLMSNSTQTSIAAPTTHLQSDPELASIMPCHDSFLVKPPKFSRPKSTQATSFEPTRREPTAPPSNAAPGSPTSASPVNSHPSLHDIERQRRQELLARKAVQASRKPKRSQGDVSSFNSTCEFKDQEMESSADIPHVSVDDFLNSIEPVLPVNSKTMSDASHDGLIADDTESSLMEVDIHSGFPAPSRSLTPPHSPLSSASMRSYSVSSTPDSIHPTPVQPALPMHTLASADSLAQKPDNEAVQEVNGGHNGISLASRRGLKRPVAADFVDIESGPSHGQSSNGYNNGSSSRNKASSFAGVSGMRRCVIDLSDSEDEIAIISLRKDLDNGRERSIRELSHMGSSTPTVPTQSRAHSGRGTPITLSAQSSNTGAPSPAALVEKEEEIRRMRELIAQRERNRLKKLAMSNRPGRTATQPIKQDGDDSVDPSLTPSVDGRDRHDAEVMDVVMQEPNGSELQPTQMTSNLMDQDIALLTPSFDADSSTRNTATATITRGVDQEDLKIDTVTVSQTQAARIHSQWSLAFCLPATHTNVEAAEPMDISIPDSLESSLSTLQESRDRAESQLSAYDSLFERYPLLRSHSRPVFSGMAVTLETVSAALLPSLRALKLATVAQMMDPSKRICYYEVPSGGDCRARDCEDVHLNTARMEPSDNVSAQYVYDGLPEEWRTRFNVQSIEEALANVRERNFRDGQTTMDLEAHVSEALMVLSKESREL